MAKTMSYIDAKEPFYFLNLKWARRGMSKEMGKEMRREMSKEMSKKIIVRSSDVQSVMLYVRVKIVSKLTSCRTNQSIT